MKNQIQLSIKKQQKVVIFTFLLVPLVLVIVFGFLPIINMFGYSFLKWDGLGQKKFIGIKNYIEVFSRPEYLKVFAVSIYYLVGSFIQLALALLFAVVLCTKIKGVINSVAIGFIFTYFFKDTGTLNSFLNFLGVEKTPLWLTNPKLVNYSLSFTSIWRYMGFNIVMFVAAIESLPKVTFEAAALDGANAWQKFRFIILPGIAPVLQINAILAVKGAVSVFEIPYIMTGGGNGSSTFVIKTMDTAFKFNKIGLASAMAIVLTIMVLLISFIQNAVFNKDEKN